MRGRYYDTVEAEEARLWSMIQDRIVGRRMFDGVAPEPMERYGPPALVKPRLGQGAFRVVITDAYRRRCALTGETTLPVLEAAHILPLVVSQFEIACLRPVLDWFNG